MVETDPSPPSQAIALIGMACRFPGASSVGEYWRNLCGGVESITSFTPEELESSRISPALLANPNYVRSRPCLDGVDLFDAAFFKITPREAELMDPQHRLFLQCAWQALESAGYDPGSYGGRIGVFAGADRTEYVVNHLIHNLDPLASASGLQYLIENDKDYLSTRVSYKLDLRGPSLSVQTACSTSLVAVHLAGESLLTGECDMALAGAVSISVPQRAGYLYDPGGIQSPDGRCRAFDAGANGTVFGSGVGVVVLKRLADAQGDRDHVHAIVLGSAVNNDGAKKVGYTAPSIEGQSSVVSEALNIAGVEAEDVTYVETHGSGTELGDPIEVTALTRAFRQTSDRKGFCAIGSVKTNIGHTGTAAGAAGLIKTVLALENETLPPSLNFEHPNPELDLGNSPFYVNTELQAWKAPAADAPEAGPRRAGVSAFGMGGTNAHLVLEQAPGRPASAPSRQWQLLPLSARTESALEQATANLEAYLRQHPEVPLADVAYTLQLGRRGFEHRRLVLSRNVEDTLRRLASGEPTDVLTHVQPETRRSVAFLLPGVGDHYPGLARELYGSESLFREILDQSSELLYPYLEASLGDLLFALPEAEVTSRAPGEAGGDLNLRAMLGRQRLPGPPAADRLHETSVAQPLVFVVEYALARLLASWGVKPQALLGYSLGEYVAACLAGVFSLADALTLVARRARMIQTLPPGRMVTVSLGPEELQPLLSPGVRLAIHSGVQTSVVAGEPEAVAELEARLEAKGVVFRPLETSHAFHTDTMASLVHPLTELVRSIKLEAPRIPYLSNVTGTWITAAEATDPGYWGRHMCEPVLFFDGLGEVLQEPGRVLLEVGPGQALGSFARQHPACTPEQMPLVLPTLPYAYEGGSDLEFLLRTLGRLWLLGAEIDWEGYYRSERRQRVPLPTYPFEAQRHWVDPAPEALRAATAGPPAATAPEPEAPVSEVDRQELDDWFYVPTWKQGVSRRPRPAEVEGEVGECWLIFADTCGVGAQIATWLEERGARVRTVVPGESFEKPGPDRYELSPRQGSDYAMLLEDLRSEGLRPRWIVHLWSVTQDSDPIVPGSNGEPGEALSQATSEASDSLLDLGFFSLLHLTQALGELEPPACDISIVGSRVQAVAGEEPPCAEKATLLGPCRVIPVEYANLSCRLIDLAVPPAGSWQAEALIANLLGELTHEVKEAVVVLRGHERWVESFASLSLPPPGAEAPPLLRPAGVYLVTGGLGGIGLAVAEHLARRVGARLVLVGRSGLPPRAQWAELSKRNDGRDGVSRQIQRIEQLESEGIEILVVQADVADEAQMRQALTQTVDRFGALNGVIHAAGVPGLGLTQLKTAEMTAAVLAPKVKGTRILERVLAELPGEGPDFLLLFSSTITSSGGLGQLDYCAANAFLDAHAQSSGASRRVTVSVDWCEWQWNAWEEGLEAFGDEVRTQFKHNRDHYGITFDEGCEVLDRILVRPMPRVVVSTRRLAAMIQSSRYLTVQRLLEWGRSRDRPRHPRPVLGTSYLSPRNETEGAIAEVWADVLGLSEIGIHDNFFELGGNSLLGIDLLRRLQDVLELEPIPARTLYEAPSVAALAKLLRCQSGDSSASGSESQPLQTNTADLEQSYSRGARRRQRSRQRGRGETSRGNQ